MDLRLYGNSAPLELIRRMIIKGKEQRSIIICGEKGLGKKHLARYIAASYLCQRHNAEPCGECSSCKMIMNSTHPDVINVKANANGNYIVDESIRPIVADSVVMPNQSRYKVYIISDLDRSVNTAVAVQNILLKLIEEPPENVVVIMTASSKQIFLPTVISRTLCLEVASVDQQSSISYLRENFSHLSEDEITQAVAAGRGNIGRCREFIEKGSFYESVVMARLICDSTLTGNGYKILRSMHLTDANKALARESVGLFGEIVRDACFCRLGQSEYEMSLSCYAQGAKKLGTMLSAANCTKLYDVVCDCVSRIDANCNLPLTLNSFAAKLAQNVK